MPRHILLVLLLCCTEQPYAQQLKPGDFDQYTTTNGLSDNAVNGIAEDARVYNPAYKEGRAILMDARQHSQPCHKLCGIQCVSERGSRTL